MSDAPVISVRGEAVLEVEPEIARLSVHVQSQEGDRRAALDRLVERNERCLELIRSYGDAIERLETGGLSITPLLKYKRREGDIRAYQGTVWIKTVVADFAVLGELVTRLGDLERTYVHGPDWDLRRDSDVYAQAARQAAQEAVARARSYAGALGSRLTGLVELSDEGLGRGDTGGPVPVRLAAAYGAAESAGEPEPIDLEPTRQTVRAAVEARFTATAPIWTRDRVKIAVVGAGSGYMPGVIRGLLHRADDLAGTELACHDIDAPRLDVMTRLARAMFAARGASLTVTAHTDLKPALDGASHVFTTFRPGGLTARHLDESIPLKHGVVGQETAGPGGFLMALRSVPILLEIAAAAPPDAWIVNYTNPTNVVTDAVTRTTGARIIGLCDQSVGDTEMWAELLGLPSDRLEADWIGLNHATWASRVRLDGAELDLPSLLSGLQVPGGGATPWRDPSRMAELARTLGFLPNSYAKYYFFHDDVVRELRAKGTTRAQDILAMLPAYHEQIAAESSKPDPDPSRERGGGEHGEFAVDVICALHRDEGRRMIVNTRNRGAIASLDDDAIVEVPAIVGRSGPVPLTMGPLPAPVRGLTQAIHAYERLASDAAVTGDRRTALQALLAHPFVRSKHTAEKILDEGLAAHRAHLPQFT